MSWTKTENSETPPPVVTSYTTLPALIAFALLVVVVCFAGFGILYFFRCFFHSLVHTWIFRRSASSAGNLVRRFSGGDNNVSSSPPYIGLDPSLLQTFPTFLYASVNNHRRKETDYSLECAICLIEFEDDSLLRLLTVCCHVFHKECIDLWLRSRKTCPVCRVDLDSTTTNEATEKCQEAAVVVEDHDQIDNVQQERRGGGDDDVCIIEVKAACEGGDHGDGIQDERLFARSHSTGHSVVMIRGGGGGGEEEEDKYLLRFPEEHVALKVVRGERNCTKSFSSYKDMAGRLPLAAPCSNCGYVRSQTVLGSA